MKGIVTNTASSHEAWRDVKDYCRTPDVWNLFCLVLSGNFRAYISNAYSLSLGVDILARKLESLPYADGANEANADEWYGSAGSHAPNGYCADEHAADGTSVNISALNESDRPGDVDEADYSIDANGSGSSCMQIAEVADEVRVNAAGTSNESPRVSVREARPEVQRAYDEAGEQLESYSLNNSLAQLYEYAANGGRWPYPVSGGVRLYPL